MIAFGTTLVQSKQEPKIQPQLIMPVLMRLLDAMCRNDVVPHSIYMEAKVETLLGEWVNAGKLRGVEAMSLLCCANPTSLCGEDYCHFFLRPDAVSFFMPSNDRKGISDQRLIVPIESAPFTVFGDGTLMRRPPIEVNGKHRDTGLCSGLRAKWEELYLGEV